MSSSGNSYLQTNVNNAKAKVHDYESRLDTDKLEDIQNSIISLVSLDMTTWAKLLGLEHSGFPYRIDINKLTIIANRPNRPITLSQMGGGENHLGCHLITYFALHKHFINQHRPFESFLFLDQPSQVYFPSDRYKKLEGKSSEIRMLIELLLRGYSILSSQLFKNYRRIFKSLSPSTAKMILLNISQH